MDDEIKEMFRMLYSMLVDRFDRLEKVIKKELFDNSLTISANIEQLGISLKE